MRTRLLLRRRKSQLSSERASIKTTLPPVNVILGLQPSCHWNAWSGLVFWALQWTMKEQEVSDFVPKADQTSAANSDPLDSDNSSWDE